MHILISFVCTLFFVTTAVAESLQGSKKAIEIAYNHAIEQEYTFLSTEDQIQSLIQQESLVELTGNRHYNMDGVSRPYVRPAVRIFVQRLSKQLHTGCGDRLTLTSALRLTGEQPANAVEKSVHPTGMALDMRIPKKSKCRKWLEAIFLNLESKAVLDATREHRPAHYHVVVFPALYEEYVATNADQLQYKIVQGDTLSGIAGRFGTTVREIVVINNLHTPHLIQVGQTLLLH